MFRWCGEGRPTWNWLIWSSVSIKAQTIRNILSVNFFIYSKHVVEQKKWFIWIKTLQLLSPKKISLKIHCSNLSQPYKNFWYLNIYVQLLSEVEFLYQICYTRFSFGYLRRQPTNPYGLQISRKVGVNNNEVLSPVNGNPERRDL